MRLATPIAALALVLAAGSLVTVLSGVQASSGPVAGVVRTQRIELVDERGVLRARLSTESSGEVVLRLLDEGGQIRVKLGASRDGSGILLANHATEPGIHILAQSDGSRIRITHEGSERVLQP